MLLLSLTCLYNKPKTVYYKDKLKIITQQIKEGKMLTYKIDVIETLKESGYNSKKILDERIIGQSSMQKLRRGEMVGIKTLEKLCELLDMQPGNIIKYVNEEK